MKDMIIKFDLYDNAMDSFFIAMDSFIRGGSSPKYYKISIKELFSAFELILKDILSQEHKSFIYNNIEDIAQPISKRHSVGFDTLLSRLEKLADFKLDDNYVRILNKLRGLRNLGMHSTFEINKHNAADIISKSVPIFMHIHRVRYDEDMDLIELLGEDLAGKYVGIQSAINALQKDAERRFIEDGCSKLMIGEMELTCLFCNSNLLVNDGNIVKCYCCHMELNDYDYFETFAEYNDEINHNNRYECPECKMDTLYEYSPYDYYICVNCNYNEGNVTCDCCFEEYPASYVDEELDYSGHIFSGHDVNVCKNCKEDLEEQRKYESEIHNDFS